MMSGCHVKNQAARGAGLSASPGMTAVVNVKVKFIRPRYDNLEEWCQDSRNMYIGRRGVVFVNKQRFPRRDSPFCNPFKITKTTTREMALKDFRDYAVQKMKEDESFRSGVRALRGKTLGCWCHPEGCHGDILKEFAEMDEEVFVNEFGAVRSSNAGSTEGKHDGELNDPKPSTCNSETMKRKHVKEEGGEEAAAPPTKRRKQTAGTKSGFVAAPIKIKTEGLSQGGGIGSAGKVTVERSKRGFGCAAPNTRTQQVKKQAQLHVAEVAIPRKHAQTSVATEKRQVQKPSPKKKIGMLSSLLGKVDKAS